MFLNYMVRSLFSIVWGIFILDVPGECKYCVSVHFELEFLVQ